MSAPKIVGNYEGIAAVEEFKGLGCVRSGRAPAAEVLASAHLDNLREGGNLTTPHKARKWHGLRRPKGNKHGQEPSCLVLLH